jgi:hypothetical protein
MRIHLKDYSAANKDVYKETEVNYTRPIINPSGENLRLQRYIQLGHSLWKE